VVDLNDIAVFVSVVQFESFSRTACALGMAVSTIGRKVTALEARLGVTLLQRTTRKLSLTATTYIALRRQADHPAPNSCSELMPVPAAPGRESLTSRRPSRLRDAQ
jgi:hypothetical protein